MKHFPCILVDLRSSRATPWESVAHRTPPQEALLCAKAKRQQHQHQMFSVAKAKRQL
ncbi:hypothetical protein [Lysinibacillus sp. G4S2]|uniref:hypothetical protein n=1 Tax=Lysinibacillus sp. G4S2 TaxID=3055859 RepID=UPI0025A20FC7|nr:hypothetical protein [Lysinibacillus sp. G4S2]MDM5249198.1 hypothetical protein [Lysinibacillus sp. G4S2]